jgi:hypothetical protein
VTNEEWTAWLMTPLPLADILRLEISEGRYQDELAAYEADLAACAEVRASLARRRPSQLELASWRKDIRGVVRAWEQERRLAEVEWPEGYPVLGDEVPAPVRLAA